MLDDDAMQQILVDYTVTPITTHSAKAIHVPHAASITWANVLSAP